MRAAASWLAFQALPRLSLSLILLPSATDLGSLQKWWKEKKTKTEHPLLPHSGSQHGGPVFSPVLYFKENCRWLEPLPVRATTNTEFWSYGNNWQDDLTIHRSELKWSHFQTIKRQTLPLALSKQFELVFCSRKNIAMSRTEKTTTCSCVLRIR